VGTRRQHLSALAVLAAALAIGAAPAAADPGDIVVADQDAFGDEGGLIRVDPESGIRTPLSSNGSPGSPADFASPRGIAFESDGDILVADIHAFGGSGGIIRVDPETGIRTIVSSNTFPAGAPYFENPSGIALEADGDILIGDVGCTLECFSPAPPAVRRAGAVIRVDPETGRRTLLSANSFPEGPPEFENPLGITLREDGELIVADPDYGAPGSGLPGALIRVDPASGIRTLLSSNASPEGEPRFADPTSTVLQPDGHMLVADADAYGGSVTANGPGGLIRVGPTGIRSLFSANLVPEGPPSFSEPVGIAFDAEGGIVVADQDALGGSGGLIRVDPVTRIRTLLSSNASPGPVDFEGPYGIAVEPASAELGSSRAALRGSRVELRVECEAGADCDGTVELRTPGGGSPREASAAKKKAVKLGSASFSVRAGKAKKVKVKLRKKGKKLFKHRSKVKAQATVAIPITQAATSATTEKLKIKKK
jgi:DNA-binding beta-propeller fold protein YncE